jgi:glycosyltransferase domain-containing protein
LNYYSGATFRIIVGDSTKTAFSNQNKLKNIEYYHMPNIPFVEKLNKLFKKVETPYTVVCADDDFITLTGLFESVKFLDENEDYVCATGRIETFIKDKDFSYRWFPDPDKDSHISIDHNNAAFRFLKYFSNYITPTFYAVTKTRILKIVFKKTSQLKISIDPRFEELLSALLTVISGKFKFIDVSYQYRELLTTSGGQTIPHIIDFIYDGSFDKKYGEFKRILALELGLQPNLNQGEASNLVDRGMNAYMKQNFGHTIIILKLISIVKNLLNLIGLLPVTRKIKNWIINKPKDNQQFPLEDGAYTHEPPPEWFEIEKYLNKHNV